MRFTALILTAAAALSGSRSARAGEDHWPGFRGTGDSHARAQSLPLEWSDEKNVAWSRALTGYGQSSPVVAGGRAFVTSIKGDEKETLIVVAIAVESGEALWQKEFAASQTAKVTDTISKAAPTPVVDDKCVYAFFESGDLFALTHAGDLQWARSLTKEYGPFEGMHGLGSSPAQTAEAIVLLVDHSGPSYLMALDKTTGKNLWKVDRDPRVSWTSPVICAGTDGPEILISSNGVAQCFAAADGKLVWQIAGLKGNTLASPSPTTDSVLIGSGQPGDSLLVRRGGAGDVAATHVAWRGGEASCSFGSPLVRGERAYFVNKAGVAFAVNLESGKTLWSQRLPGSTWASPIAAGERVYFFCVDGTTIVARDSPTFEKLAENKLTIEGRIYGVAVANGGFLIRNGGRLMFVADRR